MRQAGALLLPSDEDGTALDNARRNKKGGECVALLEAAMKLRGHLEQVGALAISRCISLHVPCFVPRTGRQRVSSYTPAPNSEHPIVSERPIVSEPAPNSE